MDEKQLQYFWDIAGKNQGFKDYSEFKSLLSNSSNRRLYFDENPDFGFESFEEFESLLGVGKPTEVSLQGSDVTSEGFVEPTGLTEASPQGPTGQEPMQNGDLSDQSLTGDQFLAALNERNRRIAGATGLEEVMPQQTEIVIPEGTEIIPNAVGPDGLPVYAKINEDGTYTEGGTVLAPVDLSPTREDIEKQQQPSAWESIKNSITNIGNQLEGFDDRLTIFTTDVYEKIFGKDLGGKIYSFLDEGIIAGLPGQGDGDEDLLNRRRDEAYAELQRLGEEVLPTLGFVDSFNSGQIQNLAAGVVNAISAVAGTAIVSVPTGGAGLITEMTGGALYDYNTAKAESEGITPQELIERGEADFWTPFTIGAAGAGLEAIGLKGVTSSITRNLTGSLAKKATVLGMDWNKEGMTEWVQGGLNAYNETIARGGTFEQATEALVQHMGSEQGLEEYLMGLVGSAGASGLGRLSKGVINKASRDKINKNSADIEAMVADMSNTDDPSVRSSLLDVIAERANEILQAKQESNAIESSLTDEQRTEINRLNSIIDSIDEGLSNSDLSDVSTEALTARKTELEQQIDSLINTQPPSTEVAPEVVDERIIAYRENNPNIELENPMDTISEFVENVMSRIDDNLPVDPVSAKETSDTLYAKYKELSDMKSDPNRTLTIAEIDGYMEQLGTDIEVLENYTTEGAPLQEQIQENETTETEVQSETDPEAGEVSMESNEVASVEETQTVEEELVVDDSKQRQFDIIQASNPAPNAVNTWVRSPEDILTAEEAFTPPREDGAMYPDFSVEDMDVALSSGEVTVYSSYPIADGVFVTPSKMNAESYSGDGKVYSKTIPISDVAWIDEGEGQYAPVSISEPVSESALPLQADFTQSETPQATPEFANEAEYYQYVSTEETNPDIVAQAYSTYSDQGDLSYVESGIADYGIPRVNEEDYNRWGDPNNMDRRKRRRWIDRNNTQVGVDVMAQEVSDRLGVEVTPEDIIEFIDKFPNSQSIRDAQQGSVRYALAQRYAELTGNNLTRNRIRQSLKNISEGRTDQERFEESSLPDQGVTFEETQARREYEEETAPRGRAAKGALKGVSDRLAKTGLARSVKFMNSQQIAEDLKNRSNIQFQTDSSELSEIESTAKANGIWMKAPNGKATNLNEKQWVLVRTKAFKDWFGDWENNPEGSSKVVDANGEPMVVYHGTNGNFTVFDPSKIGTNANAEGPGFYFTNDKRTAEGYQNANKDNPNLFEVFLNIRNPINLNEPNFKKSEIKRVIKAVINNEIAFDPDGTPNFRDSFMSNFVDTYDMTESRAIDEVANILMEDDTKIDFIAGLGNAVGSQPLVLQSVQEALGYDATVSDGYGGMGEGGGSIFVAWDSNQIKSATDNVGTFDGTNPDIRYQVSAWHGSPHKFDKFSTEFMGAGEGAQAFGWGLYFTDLESIARNYANTLVGKPNHTGNSTVDWVIDVKKPANKNELLKELERILNEKEDVLNNNVLNDNIKERFKDEIKEIKEGISIVSSKDYNFTFGRNLYSVTLHKGKTPSEYTWLEWDKKITTEFNDRIRKQAKKEGLLTERTGKSDIISGVVPTGAHFIIEGVNGEVIYDSLEKTFGSSKEASLFLLRAGIDGIKYPAESISSGATSDTARGVNYVVFDENAVEIEERLQFQNSAKGINGYVDAEGNIVINSDTAGLDTPIHEFAHIWERTIEQSNPAMHARGMELIAGPDGKVYVDHVRDTQPGLEGRELYKEALAQAIGDRGARLIESQKNGPIKEWLKKAWEFIGNLVGISGMTPSEIANLTLNQYADAVATDLLQGKPLVKLPSGDIVIRTTARTESQMDKVDKFMADFVQRMKAKNGVNFQGTVSGELSAQDFTDLTTYFRHAMDKGLISTIDEARIMARSMGIASPSEVDMAFKLAKTRESSAVGFKKSEVSPETLKNTNFDKLSDEEYREFGKRLVDEGFVDPHRLVAEVIDTPRALQPWEVTALQYYRSNIESEMVDISNKLDSNDESYTYRLGGDTLRGYKAMAQRMQFINEALFDLEVAMLTTAHQQSAAFRLRSVLSDKDFNVVQFLAEMKARGSVDPAVEQRLMELSNELNVVRAKLKEKSRQVDELQEQISTGNINYTAQQPQKRRRVKPKKEVLSVIELTLDTIDPSAFGLPGMTFQANNTIRFQTNSTQSLSAAVSDAVASMKESISEGRLSVAEAIEQAVADINSAVGEGNWDSMKFKSYIANTLVGQSVPVRMKSPYVNTNGKLVVPGSYITDIARDGADTIDKMVERVSNDLGGRYSAYDIRNAISGYGRETAKNRTDLDRAISKAKRVARLLSQIEDLETKGKRLKTKRQIDNNDSEIEGLRQEVKRLEYDLEMTPEERDQLAEQRYNEGRRKYLERYIADIRQRIDDGDFAPKTRKNRYEEDSETTALRVEAERIKNEFKKEKYRHELETRPIDEKIREYAYDLIFNITRALSAGFDASAIGVQAFIFSAARPKQALGVLRSSMRGSFSEAEYDTYFANLQADPLYEVARKAKLNLQLPSFYQSVQEEQFKGSIPAYLLDYLTGGAGEFVAKMTGGDVVEARQFAQDKFNFAKIADRNYSLVLSKVRMDLFREFIGNQVNKRGLDVELDAAEVARVAEVVNTITMASKVPGVEGKTANDIVSMIMFSARKFIATWKVLGAWVPLAINNRQLLKDAYGSVIGRGLGTLFTIAAMPNIMGTLMAMYSDDEDEEELYWYNKNWMNPKHSDFLKIRLGNTRISLFNGIDGNIVFATRFLSGEYMTSSSEAVKELGGASNNKTRGGLSWEYISNKFAPTTSILTNHFLYSDREKQESYERFKESFAPMWVTSMYEQYVKTGNVGETMALGAAGFFGLAYNNYGGAEFAIGPGTDNIKARGIFDRSGLSAYDPGNGTRKYFNGTDESAVKGRNYDDIYLPAYQEFMREAVISNEQNFSRDKHWEYKEGLVNSMKREAYKHAELELSGVVFTSAFKDLSYDGQKYVIPKSLYSVKADYIKDYMDKNKREIPLYIQDLKYEFSERAGVKPTKRYLEMLAQNELYKEAHREANERMIEDMENGKITLIPKDEYVSSEDNFEDQ